MFDATTIWPSSSSTMAEDSRRQYVFIEDQGRHEFPLTRREIVEAGLGHHFAGAANIASGFS